MKCNAIGVISANYTNEQFGRLTEKRPIASLPFGGRYRLIDFPLSNMTNSGMTTVGIITPNYYRSIQRKFPGRHHSRGSHTVPEIIGAIVGVICLGTDMDIYIRANAPCHIKHPRV